MSQRRSAEAEGLHRRTLAVDPNTADALHLIGIIALRSGRSAEALLLIGRAIRIDRFAAAFHANLGLASAALGRMDEALAAFQAAVLLMPDHATAWALRGALLRDRGELTAALRFYRLAISCDPALSDAYCDLGNILFDQGLPNQSLEAYRAALCIEPAHGKVLANRANVFGALDRHREAIATCRAAIRVTPLNATAHGNQGNALHRLGHFDKAARCHRLAACIKPDFIDCYANAALSLLSRGDLAEGWRLYERRWLNRPGSIGSDHRRAAQWRGEELRGRTILLHSEQGFGDTLQFCRYVALVVQRGGEVILGVQRPLLGLLRSLSHPVRLMADDEPLPSFDLHCPLLSLPLACGTGLDTIPAAIPYLRADADLTADWRRRLGTIGLKVGLAWRGNKAHVNDRRRSIELTSLTDLIGQAPAKVQFVSLQIDATVEERAWLGGFANVRDLTSEITDFADSAAIIANLDLVLSVDSAVGHLAGALGCETWLMLPFIADWRWMLNREDSPWYPRHRLFRQRAPGRWDGVLARMAAELRR